MPIGTSPLEWDASDEVHARALARLGSEQIAWFGTTGRDGYPHAVPIWFVWRDGRAIVFSEPDTVKVRNVRADGRVVFHLEGGVDGEEVTVLRGTAALSTRPTTEWLASIGDEYEEKYREGLAAQNFSLPEMAARYSVVIEVTPLQLIAW